MTTTTIPSLADLQQRLRASGTAPVEPAPFLPLHPDLRAAFPRGLESGGVHTLHGSLALVGALLAEPTSHGSWCAAVGLPDLNLEATQEWGVRLDRLVLIPDVQQQWLTVVADVVEAADLVIAAAPPRLPAGQVTRLESRLRHRRSAVVVVGDWPRPLSRIRAWGHSWEGLSRGHGCLVERRLHIEVSGRRDQPQDAEVLVA